MVVRLIRDHFRSHVLKSAAKSVPLGVDLLFHAPSEVANFQHVFVAHKQVFGFEISMDEAVYVQKVNACNSLDEEVKGLVLCELTHPLSVANDLKQISLLHELQDQVNVVLVL